MNYQHQGLIFDEEFSLKHAKRCGLSPCVFILGVLHCEQWANPGKLSSLLVSGVCPRFLKPAVFLRSDNDSDLVGSLSASLTHSCFL